jgi:hypothetical protein
MAFLYDGGIIRLPAYHNLDPLALQVSTCHIHLINQREEVQQPSPQT